MVRCVLLVVQVLAVITFLYFGMVHVWHCQPYGIHNYGMTYYIVQHSYIPTTELNF